MTRAQALAYKRGYALANRVTLVERRRLSVRERFSQLMALMAFAHGLRARQRRKISLQNGRGNWLKLHKIAAHG